MIAYNKTWLDDLKIKEKTHNWLKTGLITEGVAASIKEKYKAHFYTPNVFIRIGLFIFGSILISAVMSFFILIFDWNSDNGVAAICLFMGILTFMALEKIVKTHYQSGLDDVLIYASLLLIINGLAMMANLTDDHLKLACLAFPFLLFASIRYVGRLLTAMTFACFGLIILLFFHRLAPSISFYILPFLGLIYSAVVYFWTLKNKDKYHLRFWSDNFDVLEGMSLLTFYLSGNYYVLQQIGLNLYGNEQMNMSVLFWFFTFAIPFAYIFTGFKRKDRWMLDIGLGSVALAILSYRYYFHILPLEIAAIAGGAVLLIISYVSINYLNKHDTAYTYQEDEDNKSVLKNTEALIIAQSFAHKIPTSDDKTIFGGGDFGGAGASEEY